ncbi:MAG TPA: SusC/RagA family TonB-linked outer membrane protein [Chitinophagaceae bacterium]|nr:SusC/RagA family TonB-linked outer membrane protein [Chitinophagaceae bacterium]HMU57717.1 SusC/RagA family TonB-linked outer membrane protein [Chitinophagaceae bacterium]
MRKIATLFTMLLLFAGMAFGQNRTITGTVTDESGAPVPGASIKIKGTTTGVAADNNGQFRLLAKTGDVLVVSGAGLDTKEVPVGTQSVVNISVKSVVTVGSEVVVTALGIGRQKKDLGYAATKVNNEELVKARAVNVANGLQGKVSGLNITSLNNGVFEDVKINIRGIRSLLGNNNPMMLLDGVPVPLGYLSSLNPSDIADVNILKGSSAAAIYGPDAVNGVIVVTTKKGNRSGAPVVTFGHSTQVSRISFFPSLQTEFGSGGYGVYTPYENWSWGPAFDGSIREVGKILEDGSVQTLPYTATNDRKKFFNTGIIIQNDLSLATKDFYISVQDAVIKGIVPSDKNRRTGIRMNTSKEYGKFRVQFNTNFIETNYNVFDEEAMSTYHTNNGSGGNDGLMALIFNTPAQIPLTHYQNFENDKFAGFNGWFNDYGHNPYFSIDNWRRNGRSDDLLSSLELGFKANSWLNFTYRAAASINSAISTSTSKGEVPSVYAQSTRSFKPIPGAVGEGASRSSRISSEIFANATKQFGDFKLNVIAGQYFRQADAKNTSVSVGNLVVPELFNVANRAGELQGGSTYSKTRLLSVYGSVGLGYKGINVEITGRNDKTSLLSAANRSYFYPGVSASVLLSDLISVIKSSKVVSYLKLRGAWNKTGNVTVGAYGLAATFSQASGFPYGALPGFTANNNSPDPFLKPEFVKSAEFGFELGMLKNRISLEATYFNQDNTDQIIPISVSNATGYTSSTVNAASFTNKGFEVDLKLTPLLKLGKADVNFKANATYNTNKINSVYEGLDELVVAGYTDAANYIIKNYPAYVWKATDWKRDDQGRVIVDRLTGEPTPNTTPSIFGRTMPLWIVGLNPTVSYKNFTFSVLGEFKTGHYAYNQMGDDMAWTGVSIATAYNHRERFVFPNSVYEDPASPGKYIENKNITISNVNDFFTGNYRRAGTNYLTSAAAWRIREASLSYDFPSKMFGQSKIIKGVSVSLTGRNLFLWVPASNVYSDPDFSDFNTFGGNSGGIGNSQINPAVRTFGGSVSVKF